MKQPTEQEIKEFWEWCGFERVARFGGSLSQATEYLWKYPEGKHYEDTPPIDLNNLFQYAVPRLKATYKDRYNPKALLYEFLCVWAFEVAIKDNDPALALFWAIKQVSEK